MRGRVAETSATLRAYWEALLRPPCLKPKLTGAFAAKGIPKQFIAENSVLKIQYFRQIYTKTLKKYLDSSPLPVKDDFEVNLCCNCSLFAVSNGTEALMEAEGPGWVWHCISVHKRTKQTIVCLFVQKYGQKPVLKANFVCLFV